MNDGVLLIGGGLDSVTVLAYLSKAGAKLDLLHVDYGQKAVWRERSAIEYFAKKYDAKLHTMYCELTAIAYANILTGTETGKNQKDNRLEGRNVILIGLGATLASTLKTDTVYVGYHLEPTERPFPDATLETIQAMNIVLRRSYGERLTLVAPFWARKRIEILQEARRLDPQIEELAWTCYGGEETECGVCVHCKQKASMQKELATCVG